MRREKQREPGVEHAIKAAGDTLQGLADALGISSPAVAKWQRVPEHHIAKIVSKFPSASRHVMRPDLYPTE